MSNNGTNQEKLKALQLTLDKIEKGIERSRRITHQLLGFVRKRDSALSEVDLKELVDEAIQLVGREAANKDIEIIQEVEDSVWLWDEALLATYKKIIKVCSIILRIY